MARACLHGTFLDEASLQVRRLPVAKNVRLSDFLQQVVVETETALDRGRPSVFAPGYESVRESCVRCTFGLEVFCGAFQNESGPVIQNFAVSFPTGWYLSGPTRTREDCAHL